MPSRSMTSIISSKAWGYDRIVGAMANLGYRLFPTATQVKNRVDGSVRCKERLGGLLKYYHREAA